MENILELHNKTPVWNDGMDGEREREIEKKIVLILQKKILYITLCIEK